MNNELGRDVDKVEITVIVDNYTDWLLIEGTDVVKRPVVPPGKTLLAEHGLSLLITVSVGNERHTVIMDAGVSAIPIIQNAESLGIDLASVQGILISHGHIDHFGGLPELLKHVPEQTVLKAHPAVFRERRINIAPMDIITDLPVLEKTAIEEAGIYLDLNSGPSTLADGTILCLGEVERTTDFEKGFPWAEVKVDDRWIQDDFPDDQGMAIRLKSGGVVVIGGCSHAGVINTVRYAQKVAGIDKVEAVLGGFHLTGSIFEPIIPPTVEEMKRLAPHYIVPMHCTGWKAINQFASEMPEQFLLNTVGTTYVFE